MINIKENYEKKVIPYFFKEYGYTNVLALPRITKVTVNMGTGSLLKNDAGAKELIKTWREEVGLITGQVPQATRSKKSVAGFGTRKGQEIGLKVTLRGKRMRDFLERLINFGLPRMRDFSGIPSTSFDEKGNMTIGIKEHTVFPEVGTGTRAQKVKRALGFEITVTSTARNKGEGTALLRMLGFPITE